MPFDHHGDWPKALIAGYEPSAGNEYLFAALDRAIVDLQARSERDKISLCLHDGQRVPRGTYMKCSKTRKHLG